MLHTQVWYLPLPTFRMECLIQPLPRCDWNETYDPGSHTKEMQKRHFNQRQRLGMTFALGFSIPWEPFLSSHTCCDKHLSRVALQWEVQLMADSIFPSLPDSYRKTTVSCAWFNQQTHGQSPFDWHLSISTETIKLNNKKGTARCHWIRPVCHLAASTPACEYLSWLLLRAWVTLVSVQWMPWGARWVCPVQSELASISA